MAGWFLRGRGLILAALLLAARGEATAQRYGWHGYYRPYAGPYGYASPYYYGPRYVRYYGGYGYGGYGYPWFGPAVVGPILPPVIVPPPIYVYQAPPPPVRVMATRQCPDGSTIAAESACPVIQPAAPAPAPLPTPERGERG